MNRYRRTSIRIRNILTPSEDFLIQTDRQGFIRARRPCMKQSYVCMISTQYCHATMDCEAWALTDNGTPARKEKPTEMAMTYRALSTYNFFCKLIDMDMKASG